VSGAINALDWRTVLLAKHAQHVVLIHFPIALYIAGVGADLVGRVTKRSEFAPVAYWNVALAAVFTLPVMGTGLLAWQWQLEGQKLKGTLLFHLALAVTSSAIIWLTWLLQFLARRERKERSQSTKFFVLLELAGMLLVALTGHLGGFLSGVNGMP
jgi:uncharacterized membrane protein